MAYLVVICPLKANENTAEKSIDLRLEFIVLNSDKLVDTMLLNINGPFLYDYFGMYDYEISRISRKGNVFHRIQVPELSPYKQQKLSVTITVSNLYGRYEVEGDLDSYLYNKGPLSFLQNEVVIESLKKYQALKLISDWIQRNIAVGGYYKEIRKLEWTLKNKKGDCTEQAMLMVAMAREAGMPARVMGGYIMEKSGRVFAKDYHNWAEVYVDDRWIIVDPYYRVFDDGYDKYIAMQIVDYDDPNAENRRFWIEGAEGVTVIML